MNTYFDTCKTPWGQLDHVSRLLGKTEARTLDQALATSFGVSAIQLMEQAGMAVALQAEAMRQADMNVMVITGRGQNGGDGWVAARILAAKSIAVQVYDFAAGSLLPAEAEANRTAAELAGVPVFPGEQFLHTSIRSPHLIVDALFGNGYSPQRGMPNAMVRAIMHIKAMRRCKSLVLAIDVPSGLDATTGGIGDVFVSADTALSFMRAKIGHVCHPGVLLQKQTIVEELGVTPAMIDLILSSAGIYHATARSIAPLVRPLQADRHKGQGGRAALIGGSKDMPGAAVLAAKAMAMTGVGYSSLICDPSLRADYLNVLPEALYPTNVDLAFIDGQDALAYGPGLGAALLNQLELILKRAKNLVIDADGLRHLAAMPDWQEHLAARKLPAVLTPHVGEFRMFTDYDKNDRIACAVELAKKSHSIVVLKGMSTVVAGPDKTAVLVTAGNAGLAKAGSGDVLTGIVTGMLAAGLPPLSAAVSGVYIHGAAADAAAAVRGERGMLPHDVIDSLPDVLKSLATMDN